MEGDHFQKTITGVLTFLCSKGCPCAKALSLTRDQGAERPGTNKGDPNEDAFILQFLAPEAWLGLHIFLSLWGRRSSQRPENYYLFNHNIDIKDCSLTLDLCP